MIWKKNLWKLHKRINLLLNRRSKTKNKSWKPVRKSSKILTSRKRIDLNRTLVDLIKSFLIWRINSKTQDRAISLLLKNRSKPRNKNWMRQRPSSMISLISRWTKSKLTKETLVRNFLIWRKNLRMLLRRISLFFKSRSKRNNKSWKLIRQNSKILTRRKKINLNLTLIN
jgi:hypothetical protein